MKTETKQTHTLTPYQQLKSMTPSGVVTWRSLAYTLEAPHNQVAEDTKQWIETAVNSHEDYKEVAMYARAVLKALEPRFMRTGCSDTEQVAIKCLRQAIAKAEGRDS